MALIQILKKAATSDNIVLTFMRSWIASLSSAVVDLGGRVFFYSIVLTALPEFYRSNLAVAIGTIIGGVVNCAVNYKFTFHADGQSVKAVSIKFLFCWAGNLLLNMYGTTLLTIRLTHWQILIDLGLSNDQIFSMTTFLVAILVSVFWNFTVQRYFVYRPNAFDKYAIKFLDFFKF